MPKVEQETLQNKCKECEEEFLSLNEGRIFPYLRCKRCNIGRMLHEADSPQWYGVDSVKRD
ncbi:MAG: hypothetical protein HFJ35_01210 [Clostridia bacterium]|nr:hypothetical protein [Clostridia bacterium]